MGRHKRCAKLRPGNLVSYWAGRLNEDGIEDGVGGYAKVRELTPYTGMFKNWFDFTIYFEGHRTGLAASANDRFLVPTKKKKPLTP